MDNRLDASDSSDTLDCIRDQSQLHTADGSQTTDVVSPTPSIGRSRSRFVATKALMFALGVGCFVLLAGILQPQPSDAGSSRFDGSNAMKLDEQGRLLIVKSLASRPQPQGWKVLGALAGTNYLVVTYSSPLEPRYSVYTLDGRLLQADLHADEVYQSFPDLDIPALHLDPGTNGPIMSAEPLER